MPISSEEYNKMVGKMEQCFIDYNRKNFEDNKFSLKLANGDYLTIRVPKNSVAHLLGLNIDYLKASGLFKRNLNSYDFLDYFFENSYSVQKYINQGNLKYESVFSDYMKEKIDAFSYNINIRTDDMYCIIKYDREKTYQSEQVAEISDYYIVRKNPKDYGYYILGLVQSDTNPNIYVPSTSRMYIEYSDFEKFMERIAFKQEITYPYIMKVDNYQKEYQGSFILKTEEKIDLLDNVTKIAKKYFASAVVANDFSFTLRKSNLQYTNNNNVMNILKLLSENIKSGNVLEQHVINNLYGKIELPQDVSELIDTCNNVVCSMDISNSAVSSYSSLNDENISLKKELENLKMEIAQYKDKMNDYEVQISELQEQNLTYVEQDKIIEEAYEKIMSLKNNKIK